MIGKIALAFAAVLILGLVYLRFAAPRISGEEAQRKVREGAVLVDVRSNEEYDGGHLDGALNIPIRELGDRMTEVGGTDREVVVYCASGTRSAIAKQMLESEGYEHVHDLGGMNRW
ncbi:MAG: rhodanese-like domain-containing protein [Myxococcota bacterium]